MLVHLVWLVASAALLALNGTAQDNAKPRDQAPPPDQNAPALTDVQIQKLLDQLHSPEFEDRLSALHQLVGHDRTLPILRDGKVRVALISLLERETINGKSSYDLAEDTRFQYYESFLMEVAQKISADYGTPEAWKALVYSSYSPHSALGQQIAKAPQAFDLMLPWVDDPDPNKRYQALWMMGEICVNDQPLCPKVWPILRKSINSTDQSTREPAIKALALCGTAEDLDRLRKLSGCQLDATVRAWCASLEKTMAKRLAAAEEKKP